MSSIKYNDEELKQPPFKVKFDVIPKTKLQSFKKIFTGYEEGLMRSEPGGFVMVPHYCDNAEKIYQIQPRSDDIWLLTFPKCGKFIHSIRFKYLIIPLFIIHFNL
jgi:hypothetical protein